MNSLAPSLPSINPPIGLVAQANPASDLGAKAGQLLGGASASLLALAISAVTVYLLWNLLLALTKNPSPGSLGAIVVVALLAAFIAGATPSMVDAAYAYGQTFLGASE